MSVFKESEWETDDTGDKLAKELFVSKKRINKPVRKNFVDVKPSGKKLKENGKKKSGISRSDDNDGAKNSPAVGNKTNNKKRKSSAIEIDEIIRKKWKSESLGHAVTKEGPKSSKKELNKKITKLVDQERRKTGDNPVAATKGTSSKKKNSETREQTKPDILDGKKKSNGTYPETDSKIGNQMTKSQKRRLKQKEKLLKTKEENGENDLRNSDNFPGGIEGDMQSKKIDKSKLKVDRLQRLLIAKQQSGSKTGGNLAEPKSLRDRMLARLKSSRFRYLNEQMYNSESWSSKKYFKEDPDAFVAYHEGYKLQVDQSPLNPLDTIIASIKKL